VEAAERRAEEPDARRELQVELEVPEVVEQLRPSAPRGLAAKVGDGHGELLVIGIPVRQAR
jgi:hypothetical protein